MMIWRAVPRNSVYRYTNLSEESDASIVKV